MAVPQQAAAGVPEPDRARPRLPPGLWVVVPAFNEARALGGVLDELATLVPNIVVVDDGSTDETSRVALARPIWLVTHQINLGQGAALQTGVTFALAQGASHIVTFDADGQHCADDIPTLLTTIGSIRAAQVNGRPVLSPKPNTAAGVLTPGAAPSMRQIGGAHFPKLFPTNPGLRLFAATKMKGDHYKTITDASGGVEMRFVSRP